MYHPWRVLRALTEWTLVREHLPHGTWGLTRHETREVVITHGLDQAERRATLAHELEHVDRGPVPAGLRAREERRVSRIAAHKLLPSVRLIADAVAWADWDLEVAADELWVDEETLRCRLATMTHPAERAYMRKRFEEDQ